MFETHRPEADFDCFRYHQSHLKPLVEAGVRGFKCFLIESGVEVSRERLSNPIQLGFTIVRLPH